MKTLKGMKNFSSLENKKLENLKFVTGGMAGATNMRWSAETGNGSDTGVYVDNKLTVLITNPH